MAKSPDPSSQTRQVGRGFLWITTAKVYFVFTASLSALLYPRLFGDPVLFGRFRVISGFLSVIAMVVVTATLQSVSRLINEPNASVRGVRRTAVIVQTLLFGPIFLALALVPDFFASTFFRDQALSAPLRAASFVIIAYAYYAVLVGVLNGTRRFAAQAGLDMAFSTIKNASMVTAVALTASVTLAYASFSLAAVIILLAALLVARVNEAAPTARAPSSLRYLSFLLPLAGNTFLINLLLQADIIGIKMIFTLEADEASRLAGIFGAAKNVATVPYQVVMALSLALFPFVAKATSEQGFSAATPLVAGAIRLCMLISCLAIVMLGATQGDLLALLFGADYRLGGDWLLELLFGVGAMAMMQVANAILASAGRPMLSAFSSSISVAGQIALLLLFARLGPPQPTAIGERCALATLIGSSLGTMISLGWLSHLFPTAAWPLSALKTLVSASIALVFSSTLLSEIFWPLRSLIAALAFTILSFAIRAVRKEDLAVLKAALRGRG